MHWRRRKINVANKPITFMMMGLFIRIKIVLILVLSHK